MDDEVHVAPTLSNGGEHGIDAGIVGDVAGHDEVDADGLGEGGHPLAERLALVGEGQLGAVGGGGARDAPGDRAFVGDAHDQAALASHQPALLSHQIPAGTKEY